jgi:hypothetical protein
LLLCRRIHLSYFIQLWLIIPLILIIFRHTIIIITHHFFKVEYLHLLWIFVSRSMLSVLLVLRGLLVQFLHPFQLTRSMSVAFFGLASGRFVEFLEDALLLLLLNMHV